MMFKFCFSGCLLFHPKAPPAYDQYGLVKEPGEVFKQKLVNVGYSNLDMENPMDMAMQEKNHTLYQILFTEQSTPVWKVLMMFFVTGGMLALTIMKVISIHC